MRLDPIRRFIDENICHYLCDRSLSRTDGWHGWRKRRYQFSHQATRGQSSYFGKRLLSALPPDDKLHSRTSSASLPLMCWDVCRHTKLPAGLYPVFSVHCLIHNSATGFRSFHCARPTPLHSHLLMASIAFNNRGVGEARRDEGPVSFRLRPSKLTTNCFADTCSGCSTHNLSGRSFPHLWDTVKFLLSGFVSGLKGYICDIVGSFVSRLSLFVVLVLEAGSLEQPNQGGVKSKLNRK